LPDHPDFVDTSAILRLYTSGTLTDGQRKSGGATTAKELVELLKAK
jgi:hypothetical protein